MLFKSHFGFVFGAFCVTVLKEITPREHFAALAAQSNEL